MRLTKVYVVIVVMLIAQIACAQEYSSNTPVPTIVTQFPSLVKRVQESSFVVNVASGSVCYLGVGYYNLNSKWTTIDLPKIVANSDGKCEWKWKVPEDAQDGLSEIRGYIETTGKEDANIFPYTFCIERCP